MKGHLTLALDTSSAQGSVAVLNNDRVLSQKQWLREKSHSEFLTPTIQECLTESGVQAAGLDAIAVGCGPGSFTGIRIAINAARSLAYALNKPVFSFDSSEILVNSVTHTDLPVITLINAHKNLLYTSAFLFDHEANSWKRTLSLQALSLNEISSYLLEQESRPHVCLGDGYEEYEELFSADLRQNLVRPQELSDFPLASTLGSLTWGAIQSHPSAQPLDWKAIQALYVRASGAEEKLGEDRR